TLEHQKLADQTLLLLSGQTAVTAAPEQVMPPPGACKEGLSCLALRPCCGGGLHNVEAEAVENVPMLVVGQLERNHHAAAGLGLRKRDFYALELRQLSFRCGSSTALQ